MSDTGERKGDHFSGHADVYSRSRPHYPDELFRFLSSLCPTHELAWDCGTGNGQAASSLSRYFQKVFATDLSDKQIGQAFRRENIEYKVERSEECSLGPGSADLVTVATAAHWFDLPEFYKQVDKVLKPGGVLAIWSYAGCRIEPAIDSILDHFAFETLGEYWPPEAAKNWKDQYRNLPFPYPQIPSPEFQASAELNLDELILYLHSWSATNRYMNKHGEDPVSRIRAGLLAAWGDPTEKKQARWKLFWLCGRKP